MHSSQNVFTRPDTLLGVCQALGEDLGFNPLLLRVAFALPLFFNPNYTVAAYLALGLVVLTLRLLVPNPASAKVPAEPATGKTPANEMVEPEFAIAA